MNSTASVATALVFLSLVSACGGNEETVEPEPEQGPLLGLYNLPISINNGGSAPSGAVRIEISPDEMRADGHTLLTLSHGRPESSAVADHVITALREHVQGAAARRAAALSVHTNVPYLTLVETLNTLQAAGVSELHFAVRSPSEAEGWMPVRSFHVVGAEEEVPWRGDAPAWSAFSESWRPVYEACRGGQYIDCDAPYVNIAEGGTLQMELWTRDQGMKVTFTQIPPTGEDAEGEAAAPRQVELIEGVRAAPPPPSEEEVSPPATTGAFAFRQMEAAREGSAISETVRPVCANQSCRAEVVADASGLSMRIISMLGAAFPTGFSDPEVAFRFPE